jgi:hypothetical protein
MKQRARERSLTLSIGVESAKLLAKAINRLDLDDVKEAERLGITEALREFLVAAKPVVGV